MVVVQIAIESCGFFSWSSEEQAKKIVDSRSILGSLKVNEEGILNVAKGIGLIDQVIRPTGSIEDDIE